MNWRLLTAVELALGIFTKAHGYGTTISVALSYCPVTTSIVGAPILYPTNGLSQPFFLYLSGGSLLAPQFVSNAGGLSTNLGQAIPFSITPNGQLMTGNMYFSTSQGKANQEFSPSDSTPNISTTFLITPDNILQWENDVFAGRSAIFCSNGSVVTVVFDGKLPSGCSIVSLTAISIASGLTSSSSQTTSFQSVYGSTLTESSVQSITSTPMSSTMPSSPTIVRGNIAVGSSLGCLMSPSGEQAIIGLQERVSSLEECVDLCRSNKYFGLQFGYECNCGNYISPDSSIAPAGSCNIPCNAESLELCGGQEAMEVYVIVPSTGASTSTSIINTTPPTLSFTTSSISSVSAYPAPTTTGSPNCFDRSPFDGTVNGGYLILCDTDLPGSTLEAVAATNIADCINACSSYEPSSQGECIAIEFDILSETQPCQLKFSIGTVARGDNAFAQAAIVVNQPYSPQILFSNSGVQFVSSTTDLSSSTYTRPSMSSFMGLSTTATTNNIAVTSSPLATMTTSTLSTVNSALLSSTSRFSSLASSSMSTFISTSTSVVGSMTSSSLASSQTTIIFSSISPNPASSGGMTSTSMLSTSTSSTSLPVSSSTISSITTTTTTSSTTTSSSGFCLSTPTTTDLCSSYNHQALIVNSDDICYEIECGTTLQGTILNGNSSTAASLKVCFGFCTLLNVALPFGCVGVNFLGTAVSPNCILFSSINATISTPGVDGGRLIYAGYPSTLDLLFGNSTTTPLISSSSTSPSSLTTTLTTTITGATTSSGITATSTTVSSGATVTSIATTSGTSSTTAITSRTSTTSSTSTSLASTSSIASTSTTTAPTTVSNIVASSTTPRSSTSSSTTGSATVITSTTMTSSSSITTTTSNPATTTSTTSTTTTTTTTTISFSSTSCAPAPTDNSECPGTSPNCYGYNYYSPANYEIECMTVFTGAQLQPILTFALSDCIQYCQYANALTPNSCIGVSFNEGMVSQGGSNNCFRYSTLTCASRGNATYDSARMLYAGYPQITDYSNSSFICPS